MAIFRVELLIYQRLISVEWDFTKQNGDFLSYVVNQIKQHGDFYGFFHQDGTFRTRYGSLIETDTVFSDKAVVLSAPTEIDMADHQEKQHDH